MSALRHDGRSRGRGGLKTADARLNGNTAKRGNQRVRFNTTPIESALAVSKAGRKGPASAIAQSGKKLISQTVRPALNGVHSRAKSTSAQRDDGSYQDRYQKVWSAQNLYLRHTGLRDGSNLISHSSKGYGNIIAPKLLGMVFWRIRISRGLSQRLSRLLELVRICVLNLSAWNG